MKQNINKFVGFNHGLTGYTLSGSNKVTSETKNPGIISKILNKSEVSNNQKATKTNSVLSFIGRAISQDVEKQKSTKYADENIKEIKKSKEITTKQTTMVFDEVKEDIIVSKTNNKANLFIKSIFQSAAKKEKQPIAAAINNDTNQNILNATKPVAVTVIKQILSYENYMSHEEIAKELNLSKSQVWNLEESALNKIVKIITEQDLTKTLIDYFLE